MRDFTIKKYGLLLERLLVKGYTFIPFRDYQADKFSLLNVQSSMDEKSEGRASRWIGISTTLQQSGKCRAASAKGKQRNAGTLRLSRWIRANCFSKGDRTLSAKPHSLSILRHDVDLLPEYALTLTKLENKLGIFGTYFFRIVQESFEEKIIREIVEIGTR